MSADSIVLGPEARVDINGVAFAVVDGDITIKRDKVQRTDTETLVDETSGTRTKLSPLRTATVNLTAHRATDESYHAAPTPFTEQGGVSIVIWDNGRADADGALIDIPTLLCDSFNSNFTVQGSAVQTVKIMGAESDGDFFLKGE